MIVLYSKGSFVILMHVLDETFFSWIGRKWDSSLSVHNVTHFSCLQAFLNDWNIYLKKKELTSEEQESGLLFICLNRQYFTWKNQSGFLGANSDRMQVS